MGRLVAWLVITYMPHHAVPLGEVPGLLRARKDEGRVFLADCVGNERWMEETA